VDRRQAELASKLRMPRVTVNAIINGKRSVTPGTAMRLAKGLGTTPEFWINGQLAVDLYKAEHDAEQIRAVAKITPSPARPKRSKLKACSFTWNKHDASEPSTRMTLNLISGLAPCLRWER
jgi:antitoxin HigA-1